MKQAIATKIRKFIDGTEPHVASVIIGNVAGVDKHGVVRYEVDDPGIVHIGVMVCCLMRNGSNLIIYLPDDNTYAYVNALESRSEYSPDLDCYLNQGDLNVIENHIEGD